MAKKGMPVNIDGILELVVEAREMKGVMLMSQADVAETWVNNYVKSHKMARVLQQNYRGFADRIYAKGLKSKIRKAERLRRARQRGRGSDCQRVGLGLGLGLGARNRIRR